MEHTAQDGRYARVAVVKKAAANGRAAAKDFILIDRLVWDRRGRVVTSLETGYRRSGLLVESEGLEDCWADCCVGTNKLWEGGRIKI